MNKVKTQSTCFVIFGVTGDLARRKLIPALFDLYLRGHLPTKFSLIGYSRRELSDDDFKEMATEILKDLGHSDEDQIKGFLSNAHYVSGLFEDTDGYKRLLAQIVEVESQEFGECANKLLYLSVPPDNYMTILENISLSGLSIPCSDDEGWSRILVEKPFGRSTETAKDLDQKLMTLFQEQQVFRIDHYLAKESLQNILTFRLSNPIFESIWNSQEIEKIEVTMYEDNDLQSRGAFYDDVGALRDVGQNHLLQMLSLITMERPDDLSADSIRQARAKVLSELKVIALDEISEKVSRGQYQGYRQEKGVDPGSETETYFKINCQIDSDRWRGVPILLESGKALAESETAIRVFFRRQDCAILNGDGQYGGTNQLTFRLQPNEGINLHFWFKSPGFGLKLEEKTLSFLYRDTEVAIPDAYERVLFDCIRGDQTLFADTGEVMAQWRFVEPIIESWSQIPLIVYPKGVKPGEIKLNH